jgi:hypothetical protein
MRAEHSLLQFFSYEHLSEHLKEVSANYANLAKWTMANLPDNSERDVALRRLLEAKDCAVRARIMK